MRGWESEPESTELYWRGETKLILAVTFKMKK